MVLWALSFFWLGVLVCLLIDLLKYSWKNFPRLIAWHEGRKKARLKVYVKLGEIVSQNERIVRKLDEQQRAIANISELLRYR